MDILTFYTESHTALLREHFATSLQLSDGDRLIVQKTPQKGDGVFLHEGWADTLINKSELALEWCLRKQPFLCCDVDLRWYQPTMDLMKYSKPCDVMFQNDFDGGYCAGFILVLEPQKMTPVFERIRTLLKTGECKSEQFSLNKALRENPQIKAEFLPEEFWGYGHMVKVYSADWAPGVPLDPVKNIFMHHANWTKGLANKMAMLEEVKKIVEARSSAKQTATV